MSELLSNDNAKLFRYSCALPPECGVQGAFPIRNHRRSNRFSRRGEQPRERQLPPSIDRYYGPRRPPDRVRRRKRDHPVRETVPGVGGPKRSARSAIALRRPGAVGRRATGRDRLCGQPARDIVRTAVALFSDDLGMGIEAKLEKRVDTLPAAVVERICPKERFVLRELPVDRIALFCCAAADEGLVEFRQCNHGRDHFAILVSSVMEACRLPQRPGFEAFSDPKEPHRAVARPVHVPGSGGTAVGDMECFS